MEQNSKCRLCGNRDETVNAVICEFSKLAQKDNNIRHDMVEKVIHCELCKMLKFNHTTKWSMHNQKSIQDNQTHKIL